MPTGLSAIHTVSPPCLRRGLHGFVKRHASSPFSSNSLAPWLPSSSPSCFHLLKSGSRNTASIHLVWGGRPHTLARLTVPLGVTPATRPPAAEIQAPRTDSRTGLRPVEQQGPEEGAVRQRPDSTPPPDRIAEWHREAISRRGPSRNCAGPLLSRRCPAKTAQWRPTLWPPSRSDRHGAWRPPS